MTSPRSFISEMRTRTLASPGFFRNNLKIIGEFSSRNNANHDRSGDASVHAGRLLEKKSSITEIFPKFRAKRELADTLFALQHHRISITISSKSLNYASSLCPVRHHSVRLLLYVSESTLSLIDVDRLRTRKSPAFLTREMPT